MRHINARPCNIVVNLLCSKSSISCGPTRKQLLRTTSRSTRTHTQVSARRLLVSSIVRGRAGRVWRTAHRPARRSSDRALHFSSGLDHRFAQVGRLFAVSPPSRARDGARLGLARCARRVASARHAPRPPADRPALARDGARTGTRDADLRLTRRTWPLCASPACRRR